MYDWKVPVRIYGIVIDQYKRPVIDAVVSLQWVTRMGSEGIGETQIKTDSRGRFAFEGAHGKDLSVQIKNIGYYDLSSQGNDTLFEFADPSQTWFYEPDPNHPVIFHLRMKGEGVSLVGKKLELQPPNNGTPLMVDLFVGSPAKEGQLKIRTWTAREKCVPLRMEDCSDDI